MTHVLAAYYLAVYSLDEVRIYSVKFTGLAFWSHLKYTRYPSPTSIAENTIPATNDPG